MLFTQEVKDNWIRELKSGRWKQLFESYAFTDTNERCCLAVLGETGVNPFGLLNKMDRSIVHNLVEANDNPATRPEKRDYSNVLKLIEALPVQS